MVSKKQFTKQEISSINGNGERKLSNVSNYIKEFSSIIKIEKKCYICSKWKTQIKLVYDKFIASLDGLHISNSPRKIVNPKCTILAKYTIVLEDIFQNYFKEIIFEDVIFESCSSVSSETLKQHSQCAEI